MQNLIYENSFEIKEDETGHLFTIKDLETALALNNIERSLLILELYKLISHGSEDELTTSQAEVIKYKIESILSKVHIEEIESFLLSSKKVKSTEKALQRLKIKQSQLENNLLKIHDKEKNLNQKLNSINNKLQEISNSKGETIRRIRELQFELQNLKHRLKLIEIEERYLKGEKKRIKASLSLLEKDKNSINEKLNEISEKLNSNPVRIIYLAKKILPNYFKEKRKKKINLKKLALLLYKYKETLEIEKEISNKIEEYRKNGNTGALENSSIQK